MKRWWLVALFLVATVLGLPFRSVATERRVVLQGTTQAQLVVFKKRFSFLFKPTVTWKEVDRFIKTVAAQGEFEEVASTLEKDPSSPRGELITIRLVARQRILGITISGNSHFSDAELRADGPLKVGASVDKQALAAMKDHIASFYSRNGYLRSSVAVRSETVDDGNIEIMIEINEGAATSLDQITVETESPELKVKLERKLAKYQREVLTQGLVDQINETIVGHLLENRYFETILKDTKVEYSEDQRLARVFWKLENPFQFQFFFEGIQQLSSSLAQRSVVEGFSSIPVVKPVPTMIEHLQNLYLARGYANVQIEYKQRTDLSGYARQITFLIDEGAQVKVDRIEFLGHLSQPGSYYSEYLVEQGGDLLARGIFVRSEVEKGLAELIIKLQNDGFFQARVQNVNYRKGSLENQIVVQVTMDEGPMTQISQLSFEGNDSFSQAELREVVRLRPNTPLRLNDLEDGLQALKDFYRNLGYLEMTILNEESQLIEYSQSNTLAKILIKIHEGPKVYVGSIVVEGASSTHDYVILRRLTFKEGEVLTPEKISESVELLQRTGLFSSVEISTVEAGSTTPVRTVRVTAKERNRGLFELGFGVNNDRRLTLRGFSGLAYQNLFGTGRTLSSRLELNSNVGEQNYLEHKLTAGYLEPFVFESSVSGRVNLVRQHEVGEFDLTTRKLTVIENNEGDFVLEKNFSKHLKGEWTVLGVSSVQTRVTGPVNEPTTTIQQIATIGPTFQIDYRDNPFIPKSGTLTSLFLEYADPSFGSSSGVHYLKGGFSFSYYQAIKKWVWANSLRSGSLANYSGLDNSGVPAVRMFRIGGRSTVRGYANSSIPSNQELNVTKDANFDVTRDFKVTDKSFYYLIKSEMRFPLWSNVGGSIFYDGGAVRIAGISIADDYRDAAGFGLNFITPVGTINLELAFKLDLRPGEDPNVFHFSIGSF